jgi:hypothetical protein
MTYHIQENQSVVILALHGQINVDEVREILHVFTEADLSGITHCIIDCREAMMVYTDIATSVKHIKKANCGIKLVLVGMSQWVNVVRSMLVDEDYLPLFHTLADALSYTQEQAV